MPRVTRRTTKARDLEAELVQLMARGGIKTPERWRDAARKASAALYQGHETPGLRDTAMALLDGAQAAGVGLSNPEAQTLRRLLLSWER